MSEIENITPPRRYPVQTMSQFNNDIILTALLSCDTRMLPDDEKKNVRKKFTTRLIFFFFSSSSPSGALLYYNVYRRRVRVAPVLI